MNQKQSQRLRDAMEKTFPEAMVEEYQDLIPAMRNAPEDRHVAAAAVAAGARVIVTANLRDFRGLPSSIQVQSPDEFLGSLFDLGSDEFVALLERQAADLEKPAISVDELLGSLGRSAPNFESTVRRYLASRPAE